MLSVTCIQGEEIGLDASWQYSAIHPGESDDVNSFNQRYGLQWNPRVTRAILLNANLSYSKNVTTGNIIRQTLSPTGSLQVDNDLFFAEVSGLVNQATNSQSHNQLNRNWEALLASNWEYDFWPSLSVTLGQSWLSDGEEVPLTDTSNKWSEFIVQWELDTFESYYSYYTQLRADAVENTSYDEKKHFGRMDYGNSFFGNLLRVQLSGQLTDSTTDFSSFAGAGDNVSIRVGASQTLAGVDPLPVSGRLPNAPALSDGNRNNTAFAINLHEVANLGVKINLQAVDTLYVYTGQIDPLFVSETGSLRWDLYSSDDGVNWRLETSNPATIYDQDRARYQVNIGNIERIYLKLVVTAWPVSLSVPITEIEAYRNQGNAGDSDSNFSDSQKYSRTLFDMNVRYAPTTNTSLNYSLVWDNTESSPGNTRKRLFQAGNINWLYSQYFSPSFTVNSTTTVNSGVEDTSQRTYAINIQSLVLPTLEASLGLTRNENATDNVLQAVNHSVHLNVTAALYPDLDSTFEVTTNFSQNEELDSSTDNLGLRWALTSRLRSSLLVDFIWEHGTNGVSFSDILGDPDSGGQTTLNVNWRPSDLVSIQLNGSKGYGGEAWAASDSVLLDTNVTLVRTSKTTFILGYRTSAASGAAVHGVNANWSWNLSEFFTMQSIASYLVGQEEDSWLINTRLTSRF